MCDILIRVPVSGFLGVRIPFNYMHIEWPSWQFEINRIRSLEMHSLRSCNLAELVRFISELSKRPFNMKGHFWTQPVILMVLCYQLHLLSIVSSSKNPEWRSWIFFLILTQYLQNLSEILGFYGNYVFYRIGILLWNGLFHNCGFHLIKVSEFLSVLTYLIEKTKSRNFLDFVTEEYFSVVFGIFEESRGLWHVGWGIVGKIWKKSTKSWRT